MRRAAWALGWVVGVYALAWVGYVVKSAAGIDVLHDGVHHGPWFPGSDAVVARLRGR